MIADKEIRIIALLLITITLLTRCMAVETSCEDIDKKNLKY